MLETPPLGGEPPIIQSSTGQSSAEASSPASQTLVKDVPEPVLEILLQDLGYRPGFAKKMLGSWPEFMPLTRENLLKFKAQAGYEDQGQGH